MWWSPWFDRSTAHVAQHANSLGRSVASKAHGAGGSTSSQLKTSADGTFYMFIQCAYNTYNYADIITGLQESNTCMTWDLWGVRIWRFWIMMRMERFQDCFGVSNVANFCSTRPHVVQSLFHSEVCSGCSHCAAQRSGVCTWERLLVEQKQTALPAFFSLKAELGVLVSSLKQGEIKYSDRLMAFLVTCWVSSINLSNSCQRNTGLQWKMFRVVLAHQ